MAYANMLFMRTRWHLGKLSPTPAFYPQANPQLSTGGEEKEMGLSGGPSLWLGWQGCVLPCTEVVEPLSDG